MAMTVIVAMLIGFLIFQFNFSTRVIAAIVIPVTADPTFVSPSPFPTSGNPVTMLVPFSSDPNMANFNSRPPETVHPSPGTPVTGLPSMIAMMRPGWPPMPFDPFTVPGPMAFHPDIVPPVLRPPAARNPTPAIPVPRHPHHAPAGMSGTPETGNENFTLPASVNPDKTRFSPYPPKPRRPDFAAQFSRGYPYIIRTRRTAIVPRHQAFVGFHATTVAANVHTSVSGIDLNVGRICRSNQPQNNGKNEYNFIPHGFRPISYSSSKT